MSNLLAKAFQWLEDQRTRHATSTVQYVRGGQTASVPATVGRTTYDLDNGYGVLVRYEFRDFLVLASDLVLGAGPTLPQRGDRIRETHDGRVFVYEVTAPGKEPCWQYSDPYRKAIRIHTKQVEDT